MAVYKYCRPWAVAQEPTESRAGALTPIAPYAVEEAEADVKTGHRPWKLTSTCRAMNSQCWSKDNSVKAKTTPAAGGGASEREPHCSMEAMRCIQHSHALSQHGGPPNYKEEMSVYQAASEPKALARHHRRTEQARTLPHNVREARWYKCFRQMEGQWEQQKDSQTRVTGTDFSVLPAGYIPKHGHLPNRHILEKYGFSASEEDGESAVPVKRAGSKVGGAGPEATALPSAWAQKAALESKKAFADKNIKDIKTSGEQQKMGFGAWAKAARNRSKLKGAEYMKAPIALMKEMPVKLKPAEYLAELRRPEKGEVKYFNNQEVIPNEELFK